MQSVFRAVQWIVDVEQVYFMPTGANGKHVSAQDLPAGIIISCSATGEVVVAEIIN